MTVAGTPPFNKHPITQQHNDTLKSSMQPTPQRATIFFDCGARQGGALRRSGIPHSTRVTYCTAYGAACFVLAGLYMAASIFFNDRGWLGDGSPLPSLPHVLNVYT